MDFDVTKVLDLQSMQVQAIAGFLISWVIKNAVQSNLPLLHRVKLSWGRKLSVLFSFLSMIGIHCTWNSDWTLFNSGTINLSLMVASLPDIVNGLFQFLMNESNYHLFFKDKKIPVQQFYIRQ